MLRLMELPFEMAPVREIAQWSSRSANDPAIAWLVERLKPNAEQLVSKAGAPLDPAPVHARPLRNETDP